jgi:SHS2 domain-containing protein
MQKFRYVPHTADMAFIGYGSTFKKAIENSALALLNIMLDIKSISKGRSGEAKINIRESAETHEDLVWFTLQDILSKIDEKKLNALRFDVTSLSEGNKGFRLEGELICKKTKGDNSLISVKAVTPHGLKVRKEKGMYSIHVVVDV